MAFPNAVQFDIIAVLSHAYLCYHALMCVVLWQMVSPSRQKAIPHSHLILLCIPHDIHLMLWPTVFTSPACLSTCGILPSSFQNKNKISPLLR